jgi:hypothetical protein
MSGSQSTVRLPCAARCFVHSTTVVSDMGPESARMAPNNSRRDDSGAGVTAAAALGDGDDSSRGEEDDGGGEQRDLPLPELLMLLLDAGSRGARSFERPPPRLGDEDGMERECRGGWSELCARRSACLCSCTAVSRCSWSASITLVDGSIATHCSRVHSEAAKRSFSLHVVSALALLPHRACSHPFLLSVGCVLSVPMMMVRRARVSGQERPPRSQTLRGSRADDSAARSRGGSNYSARCRRTLLLSQLRMRQNQIQLRCHWNSRIGRAPSFQDSASHSLDKLLSRHTTWSSNSNIAPNPDVDFADWLVEFLTDPPAIWQRDTEAAARGTSRVAQIIP